MSTWVLFVVVISLMQGFGEWKKSVKAKAALGSWDDIEEEFMDDK